MPPPLVFPAVAFANIVGYKKNKNKSLDFAIEVYRYILPIYYCQLPLTNMDYWLVITSYQWLIIDYWLNDNRLKITNYELLQVIYYRLPITHYQIPITNCQLPITNYPLWITDYYEFLFPNHVFSTYYTALYYIVLS